MKFFLITLNCISVNIFVSVAYLYIFIAVFPPFLAVVIRQYVRDKESVVEKCWEFLIRVKLSYWQAIDLGQCFPTWAVSPPWGRWRLARGRCEQFLI